MLNLCSIGLYVNDPFIDQFLPPPFYNNMANMKMYKMQAWEKKYKKGRHFTFLVNYGCSVKKRSGTKC